MKKIFYVFVISLFVYGNCKKSDVVALETYLPNTIGSNWTYRIVAAGGAPTTSTFTVSNRDTTANSRKYNVITGTTGGNQYYSKNGSDYYTFRGVSTSGLELLFLKDNLDVNGTWATSQLLSGLTGLPGGISSVTVNTAYKIESKGGSRPVNGTTYNNVIKVRADLTAVIPILGSLSFGYAEFYFAKNIGIIESDFKIANTMAGININELYTLQSYVIK